jgi:hypothetical protein
MASLPTPDIFSCCHPCPPSQFMLIFLPTTNLRKTILPNLVHILRQYPFTMLG